MPITDYLFTSESVTEGHPDKIADQISDAILDAIIAQDKRARVACETLVTTGLALIAGEITTDCWVDMPQIVRETIRGIGYCDSGMGFDWETCGVMTSIDKQSPDIAMGVNSEDQGAGDQGLMFGYACEDTPELMPMPILYAHRLTQRLAEVRKNGTLDFLRPDGKSQVTIRYSNCCPVEATAIVIAAQHKNSVSLENVREGITEEIIKKIIPQGLMTPNTKVYINTTGRFVIGGPMGDCGITGRKIIVDTYGGVGSHGGGAFSGKDPSKVDRTASYMARYIAKNVVAAKLAKKCEVQLAYAIGKAEPVSVMIDDYDTSVLPNNKLRKVVMEVFPMKPGPMIQHLDLLRPIFQKTAAYGHFGRQDADFTWEKTDMIEQLQSVAGRNS
ncbi:MAG: methionine adenosyltransferase [Pseudomonadota bacterium]